MAGIPKYQDNADQTARIVGNGRGAIFNRYQVAFPVPQDRVIREAYDHPQR